MLVGLPNALSRGVFAMTPESAAMYMPAVIGVLEGKINAENPGQKQSSAAKPYAISADNGEKHDTYVVQGWSLVYRGFSDAPKNSVAVIPISDVIMKYDYCGAYGTLSFKQFLDDAISAENIKGIVLAMDTPGGEVSGTRNLSEAIGNCSKPVVAHIDDGYCASAGVYIACKANKILLSQPTDKIGSIGVYTTLIDPTGAYEALGYKIKTIYSPTSTQKNAAWRAAMEKDDVKPMQKDLAFLDQYFMQSVRDGRGAKLNEEVLAGGMYYAEEAIEKGLADGIATFKQAIEEVINLSEGSLTIG